MNKATEIPPIESAPKQFGLQKKQIIQLAILALFTLILPLTLVRLGYLPFLKRYLPLTIAPWLGWTTNFLAVKMLFWPHEPKRFLGYTFYGMFPKEQKRIARKVASTVERRLLSPEEIGKQLVSPEIQEKLLILMDQQVEDKINSNVPKQLRGKITQNLTKQIQNLMKDQAGKIIERYAEGAIKLISEELDMKEIIEQKVNELDSRELELTIQEVADKELMAITQLGGIIGFLVGLIQVLITL